MQGQAKLAHTVPDRARLQHLLVNARARVDVGPAGLDLSSC